MTDATINPRPGWLACSLAFPDARRQQLYCAFEQAWLSELQPAGLLELESFHHYVRASWHLREIIEAQNLHAASGPAAFLDESAAKTIDRLHRYERDFERRATRHLAELRRLQTARGVIEKAAPLKRTQLAFKAQQQLDETLGYDLLCSLQAREVIANASPPPSAADQRTLRL